MTLQQWRQQNGLTMRDFAKLIGTDHAYICRIEHGKIIPGIRRLQEIKQATGGAVSFEDFVPYAMKFGPVKKGEEK